MEAKKTIFELKPFTDEEIIEPMEPVLHIDCGDMHTEIFMSITGKFVKHEIRNDCESYDFNTGNGYTGFGTSQSNVFIQSNDMKTLSGCELLFPLSYKDEIFGLFLHYFQKHGVPVKEL